MGILDITRPENIATEACKKGHVKVNGSIVKPSREVYPTDTLVVRKNQIDFQLTVLDIPASSSWSQACRYLPKRHHSTRSICTCRDGKIISRLLQTKRRRKAY